MGASDVVPGVSGGTMAFILGIYEELIQAIQSFDLAWLRLVIQFKIRMALNKVAWEFLIVLGFGILSAVFSLARLLSWLLDNQPVLIWSFFFGLIVASAVTVARRTGKWQTTTLFGLMGGAIGAYLLVGFIPVSTPETTFFVVFSGAVAICAMILPGISGSFILVLLGKYHYILEAVNRRDVFTLLVFFAGAVIGIVGFSRVIGWLFKKYHDVVVAVLTGLMVGSLRKVWPWKQTILNEEGIHSGISSAFQTNTFPAHWSWEVTWGLILMLTGFLIVFSLDNLANRNKSLFPNIVRRS
jgi:putative membrane protein